MRQLAAGNAHTGISYAHRILIFSFAQAQRNLTTGMIILQTVIQQVEENFLHQRRNTKQLAVAAGAVNKLQADLQSACLVLQACQRTLRHILQRKFLHHIMRQLIELRQLHDVINQTQQIVRLIVDFLQKALGILRLHQAAEHNFRIAQHRLQRCLQLMRNVSRKLTADFLRSSTRRHIHNQQHKALIGNSAAV